MPATNIKLLNNLIIKLRWYFECHVSVLMLKYEETIIDSIPAAAPDKQSATRHDNATISVFSSPIRRLRVLAHRRITPLSSLPPGECD